MNFTKGFEGGDNLKPRKEELMIFQEGVKVSEQFLKIIEQLKKTDRAVLTVIEENSEFLEKLDQLLAHNHEYFQHSLEMISMATGIREELKEEMDLSDHELTAFFSAALLHDVGKIEISNDILEKNGKLEIAEEEEIRKHVEYGYKIAQKENPEAACILAYHHMFKKENPYCYEEKNMYCGESRETYVKLGKILAIIDVFHALSHPREYKPEMSPGQCISEINKELELSEKDKKIVGLLVASESRRRKNAKVIIEK